MVGIKLEHLIAVVGIVVSTLLTLSLFLINFLRADIKSLRASLEKIFYEFVSNTECQERRRIICGKIDRLAKDFEHHRHDGGNVFIDKTDAK